MNICDNLIVIFGIRGFCLGFLKTSHVDILDRFRNPVVDTVKTDVCIFKKETHPKEKIWKYNMQMNLSKLGNGLSYKMCLSIHLWWKWQWWNKDNKFFIMHGLVLCIKVDSYVAQMLFA